MQGNGHPSSGGAAGVMAANRADTIGAMLLDAGKNITEADVEVSEAIDFANYYAKSMLAVGWDDGTVGRACGVVVVTPPWNFPFAIRREVSWLRWQRETL